MLLAPLVFTLLADLIVLRDGRTWTGEIVEEQAERVKIRLTKGAIWVPRADIARIETAAEQRAEYKTRAAAAAAAADHRALALWCRERGLAPEEAAEWNAVVAADPSNEEAHKALGHVQVDGTWLTDDEAKKALGLVDRGGELVTPLQARILDLLDQTGSEDLVGRGEARKALQDLDDAARVELAKLADAAEVRLAAALEKQGAAVGALQDRAKAVRGLLLGLVTDEERYVKRSPTEEQVRQVRDWVEELARIGGDPAGAIFEADPALARDAARLARVDAVRGAADRGAALRAGFLEKTGGADGVFRGIDPFKALRARTDAANRDVKMGERERALLDLESRYRLRLGRSPLLWDAKLEAAARQHSAEMLKMDYFSHVSPVKKYETLTKRLELVEFRSNWIGENLARGEDPPEAILQALVDSPGHHRNLVFADFTRVAIAKEGEFWTMCFGGDPKE